MMACKSARVIMGAFTAVLIIGSVFMTSCSTNDNTVVVYVSIDQVYADPILKEFETKTGIRVLAVPDVEASKTTGLVNRLIAEKNRPQADVFWSGEFAQTIMLKEKGILAPYISPAAADIPEKYKDPEGYWTFFGGRARVLLVNTAYVKPADYPASIFDLPVSPVPGDKIGIAYPVFGTTATQAAALYALLGADRGRDFFEQLKLKGVRTVDGNSVVRSMVEAGDLYMGLVDTDDAYTAMDRAPNLDMIFLDQGSDGIGTLISPNSVAMIAKSKHQKAAEAFIDFLVSRQTEQELLNAGWFDLTVRPMDTLPARIRNNDIKGMNVSFEEIYGSINKITADMAEIFNN